MLNNFLTTEYSETRASLAVYRVLFCLLVLMSLPESHWLHDLPPFMFAPPISPVAVLTNYPHPFIYDALNGAGAVFALCLLFGILPTASALLLSFSMFGIRAFAYSSGKINHDILLPIIPAVFAFTNWGSTFRITGKYDSLSEKDLDDGFPIAIFALLTSFWMATAGWQKLTTDWLSGSYSVVLRDIHSNYFVTGRHSEAAAFALSHFPGWAWEATDWFTVVFELCGIVVVWRRSLFRVWLFAACFFHLGINILMLIPYTPALIAYGVFVPWAQLPIILPWLYRPRFALLVLLITAIALKYLISSLALSHALVWVAPLIAVAVAVQSGRNRAGQACFSTDCISTAEGQQ